MAQKTKYTFASGISWGNFERSSTRKITRIDHAILHSFQARDKLLLRYESEKIKRLIRQGNNDFHHE